MHTLKIVGLAVSLIGITAAASYAEGGPHHYQKPCAPVVQCSHQQRQAAARRPETMKEYMRHVDPAMRWKVGAVVKKYQKDEARRQQRREHWRQMARAERQAGRACHHHQHH